MTLWSIAFCILAVAFVLLSLFDFATNKDEDSLLAFFWAAGAFASLAASCFASKSPDLTAIGVFATMTLMIVGMLIYAKMKPKTFRKGF